MKIGIVGYQAAGKSTMFSWLTGVEPDLSLAHSTQTAMAQVPDGRIAQLCDIYKPKKVTMASLEIVDTPGLSRTHEGNAARLAQMREAGSLVVVVPVYSGADPAADLASFEEDLLLTDLEIVTGRITRLEEQIKKPRPDRDELSEQLDALRPLAESLENGQPMRVADMTDIQYRATRSFGLLTEKPRLALLNVADDEEDPAALADSISVEIPCAAVRLRLESELGEMEMEERDAFLADMGLVGCDRDELIRRIMDVSGQMLFFTAGEKEVRTWMFTQGGVAVDAAGGIHTDMARGFIRAETIACSELVAAGSEREAKAQNLFRQEPKDYVIQDGDVLNIKFNV